MTSSRPAPVQFPSNFTCTGCHQILVHRYSCVCPIEIVAHTGQCTGRGECSTWYCVACQAEEKIPTDQLDEENKHRGSDLVTLNGGEPLPDELRHYSEKEHDVLRGMLERLASPGAKWQSVDDIRRCARPTPLFSPIVCNLPPETLQAIDERG